MGSLTRKFLVGIIALFAALLFSCGEEKEKPSRFGRPRPAKMCKAGNSVWRKKNTWASDTYGPSVYKDLIAEFPADRKLAMTKSIVFDKNNLFETMYGWTPFISP